MWRSIVAFGTVPALAAVYFRLTIPETPRYTADITLDVEKAKADAQAYLRGKRQGQVEEGHAYVAETRRKNEAPKATWSEFFAHFRQWRYGKILLGTAGSWFFIDVAFWGLGLNNSAILGAIGYASSKNVYDNLYNTAVGNLILAVAGNIPGYWVSVALIDTIGRKPIQMASFIILTILFCVIGFAYHSLSAHTLLALYVLCQFFSNFGANSTTFIGEAIGEISSLRANFSSPWRSVSHTLSVDSARYLSRCGKSRCCPRSGLNWAPKEQDWHEQVAESRHGNFCSLHGLWSIHHLADSRDKASNVGGAGRKIPR